MTNQTFAIHTQWLENYGSTAEAGYWKSKGGSSYKVTVPASDRARNHAVALAAQQFIVNEFGVEYLLEIEEVYPEWMPSHFEGYSEDYGEFLDSYLHIISVS
tara:strand:- start:556 stop:861 length:306 start_codon:yes stop_codon:yes gene_type:complete